MTQFPAGSMPLGDELRSDNGRIQDSAADDILPSAGDPSGLSAAMRQRIDSDVQSAGNANQVVATLRARIADIDAQTLPEDDPAHIRIQAERALAVAEISYLEEHHGANPMTAAKRAVGDAAAHHAPATSTNAPRAVMRDLSDDDNPRARIYDR